MCQIQIRRERRQAEPDVASENGIVLQDDTNVDKSCSIGTESELNSASDRRSVAMEMANLFKFDKPLPNHEPPIRSRVREADNEIFSILADLTDSCLRVSSDRPRPLDKVFDEASKQEDFKACLVHLPIALGSRALSSNTPTLPPNISNREAKHRRPALENEGRKQLALENGGAANPEQLGLRGTKGANAGKRNQYPGNGGVGKSQMQNKRESGDNELG